MIYINLDKYLVDSISQVKLFSNDGIDLKILR